MDQHGKITSPVMTDTTRESLSSSQGNTAYADGAYHLLSHIISTIILMSSYRELVQELLNYIKTCKYSDIIGEEGGDLQNQFLLAYLGPEIQRIWGESGFQQELLREVNDIEYPVLHCLHG